MANTSLALDHLRQDLTELKLIFEFPKYYIAKYFNDLKNEIDLAFVKKKQTCDDLSQEMKIDSIWTDLRNKTASFEKECKQKQETQPFSQEVTQKIINLIEESFNRVLSNKDIVSRPGLETFNSELFNSYPFALKSPDETKKVNVNLFQMISSSEQTFKKFRTMTSISENEEENEDLHDLYDLIYDERKVVEKCLFLSRTMFFIKYSDLSNDMFAQLDPKVNAGTLVLIEDDYFDCKTVSFFKKYLFVIFIQRSFYLTY